MEHIVTAILLAAMAPGAPAALPVYAHNDYRNERPLERALELGFRGVEVDYFVVEGELRVGHDPPDTRPGRTLESMYLEPLRERWQRDGEILPGGEPFILNIESKREGVETYETLHAVLSRYDDMLTVVREGVVTPGPVQVILVGWFPPLDYLSAQSVRYAAVQCHYKNLSENHERHPAHLLKLISYNYKEGMMVRGAGPVPRAMERRLERVVAAAHAVPGRISRVFNVPGTTAAYRAILGAGVDLIGTKDIEGARRTLDRLSEERSPVGGLRSSDYGCGALFFFRGSFATTNPRINPTMSVNSNSTTLDNDASQTKKFIVTTAVFCAITMSTSRARKRAIQSFMGSPDVERRSTRLWSDYRRPPGGDQHLMRGRRNDARASFRGGSNAGKMGKVSPAPLLVQDVDGWVVTLS